MSEADPADIPQLCELLAELFAQESDFRPDRAKQAAGLRLVLENPDLGRILVLRGADGIIGMAGLLFFINARHGGLAVTVEDVIVRRSHRGTGLGSLLLRQAVAFARSMDAVHVNLLTDRDNAPAIRLYRRHGFSERSAGVLRWTPRQ